MTHGCLKSFSNHCTQNMQTLYEMLYTVQHLNMVAKGMYVYTKHKINYHGDRVCHETNLQFAQPLPFLRVDTKSPRFLLKSEGVNVLTREYFVTSSIHRQNLGQSVPLLVPKTK